MLSEKVPNLARLDAYICASKNGRVYIHEASTFEESVNEKSKEYNFCMQAGPLVINKGKVQKIKDDIKTLQINNLHMSFICVKDDGHNYFVGNSENVNPQELAESMQKFEFKCKYLSIINIGSTIGLIGRESRLNVNQLLPYVLVVDTR